MIDWLALEEQFNSRKPQAKEGTYKAELESIEVKQLPSGSIPVTFKFKPSSTNTYPWCTHWVSTKNAGWTQWHHLQMLQVLGINKDNAKAAIDNLYNKEIVNTEELVRGFEAIYKKAAEKHPTVEIVVRPQRDKDGKFRYSDKGYQQFESEFTDPRVFSSNEPKLQENVVDLTEAPEPEEATKEIDLESVPF